MGEDGQVSSGRRVRSQRMHSRHVFQGIMRGLSQGGQGGASGGTRSASGSCKVMVSDSLCGAEVGQWDRVVYCDSLPHAAAARASVRHGGAGWRCSAVGRCHRR